MTGFFLPADRFLPSHAVGIISLVILAAAIAERIRAGIHRKKRWKGFGGEWIDTPIGGDTDPGHAELEQRLIDMQGRSAGFNGARNSTASLFVPGHVGDYYFQVQGNTLFSDQVMYEAALAFTRTKGTLADHVMAAMEAADAKGGDKRCNCETDP